jgi:hypothetical protein
MIQRHNNIVYTAFWVNGVLAGGGNQITTFRINDQGRMIQIKSLTISWQARFAVSGLNIPPENNTTQIFALRAFPAAGQQFSRTFDYQGGTAFTNTGDEMRFFAPGQYKFDSFFIANELDFSLSITNLEAALAVNHLVSIMVEIVEDLLQSPRIAT